MRSPFLYTKCVILFISNFSITFPATFVRLIDLNFVTSIEFSLPGFVIGTIFTFFHFLGKRPLLRHSLYSVYIVIGNCLYTLWCMSAVISSSPGAFFGFSSSMAFLTSSVVYS
jgi:hypothetical protein